MQIITLRHLDTAKPSERALVAALAARNIEDVEIEDFQPYTDAYANAMRLVNADHLVDLDICALTAEALMGRTPWKLWDLPRVCPKRVLTRWRLWR